MTPCGQCRCHDGGEASSIPCSVPGGCGHLHRDTPDSGESVTRLLARRRFLDNAALDADDIAGYLPRLRDLLADTGTREHDGSAHRKVSGSPAPWNTPVANLLGDIHTGARDLADTLTVALGHHQHPYGTTTAGTGDALTAVARDARALHDRDADRRLPDHCATQLRSWARQCRRILDELRPDEQPWTQAPGDLRCPNQWDDGAVCDERLWLAPGWQHHTDPPVYCRRCRDDTGQPYSWPHAAWYLAVTQRTA